MKSYLVSLYVHDLNNIVMQLIVITVNVHLVFHSFVEQHFHLTRVQYTRQLASFIIKRTLILAGITYILGV